MTSVLLVDDHEIVRKGVRIILESVLPKIEVDEAETGMEAMNYLQKGTYDLVFLDIGLPDTEPLAFMQNMLNIYPDLRIIVFSMYPEHIYGKRVLAMGVKGFLNKREAPAVIKQAIEKVMRGEVFMTENLKNELAASFISNNAHEIDSLSDRELEVLLLLVTGLRLKEISNKLHLQMSTVSTYKRRIFEKLDVDNIIDLKKKAMMYGLVMN